jgi:hypothetical protein
MSTGIIVTIAGLVAITVGFPPAARKRGVIGVVSGILLIAGIAMLLCGVTLIAAPNFFAS